MVTNQIQPEPQEINEIVKNIEPANVRVTKRGLIVDNFIMETV